tara:strand:- start:612 stop:836 length:225 start_codon:yes stop_codon:yes gene_type:complete
MAQYYSTICGNRGEATRCGTKDSGISAVAASWDGCIRTNIWYDASADVNRFEVVQSTWQGKGIRKVLSVGIVGE